MKKKSVKPVVKSEPSVAEVPAASKKPAAPRTTTRRTAAKSATPAVKTTTRRATPRTVKATVAVQVPAVEVKSEDIALRAYFISEDRQKAGLPGSPEADWVEAERQLRAEAVALLAN
jgi:hypothetical protein